MKRAIFSLALLALATAATAAPVALTRPAPLAPDNAALPRLTTATPGSAKINAALARLDERWRKAMRECKADGGGDASTSRSVSATMAGPKVVSLLITDEMYCGGAHPDSSAMAVAYDLESGRPLDWTRLLPKALVTSATLDTHDDGSSIGAIVSPRLHALYLAAARAQSGHDASWTSNCGEVLDDEDLPFQLWPDAKAGGVMLAPLGLPHAVAACADALPLPTATLRRLGADAGLLDAIDAAHAGR